MNFCPECGKRLAVGGFCSQCQIQYGVGQGQGTHRQRAEFQIFKDFEFACLPDGTYCLEKCKNTTLKTVVIPAEVSALGAHCFSGCEKLTSVTFEGRMECIAEGAFWGCSALEEIVLPQGLTVIDDYAFYGCSALEEITVPNGVSHIGREAFWGCSSLTAVAFPSGLVRVGKDAFDGCNELADVNISDLRAWCDIYFENEKASPLCANGDLCLNDEIITDLKIPDGVYALNDFAFLNCDLIESVRFPASLGSISPLAFYRCSGIERFVTEAGNKTFRTVGGGCCLVSGNDLVLACEGMEEFPTGVRNVRAGAFAPCTDMCVLEIPEGVTLNSGALLGMEGVDTLVASIGTLSLNSLFTYECRGQVNGAVPEYFMELELHGSAELCSNQLRGCKKIDSLKLEEGYTRLGDHALSCLSEVKTLSLPRSITSVGAVDTTFNGIRKLNLASGGVLELREGCLIHTKEHLLIASFQSVAIPKGIRRVAPYAFAGNRQIRSIYVGDSVMTVGEMAFFSCPNLERATFGPSLIEIYCNIFRGCKSLRDVVLEGQGAWDHIRPSGSELTVSKWDRSVSYWMRIFHPQRTEYERIVKRS